MADNAMTEEQLQELKKKRTFRKYQYRGVDLDQLLDLTQEKLAAMLPCRQRRRLARGWKRKHITLLKKLRASKKVCSFVSIISIFIL